MTPARLGHRAGGNYVYHYKAAGASKGELLTGTEDSLVIQERPRRSASDGLGRPVHRPGPYRYQVTNETPSYIISTFAHRLYPSIMNSINRTRGVVPIFSTSVAGRQEDQFATGMSALADVECSTPVLKGESLGDRNGELTVCSILGELAENIIA